MKVYTHPTKNDLAAWAPIRLERPNKIWGPGIDLRTTWKISSLKLAYEHNGLTAYFVGCHNIVSNWITEIADLLPFFVLSLKLGLDYASREVQQYCLFDSLKMSFFSTFFTKKHNTWPIKSVAATVS